MSEEIINMLEDKLICPYCRVNLNHHASCPTCKKSYKTENGKLFFLQPNIEFKREEWFDELKGIFKQKYRLYDFLIKVISPVYIDSANKVKKWVKLFERDEIIVNIGSGPLKIYPQIISLDVFDYENVDIVADASNLPFRDNSIDGIISIAVLEHVKEPEKHVFEFYRVLKKNGEIFVFIPFIQGYHASPNDYHRWTMEGAKELFKHFEKIEVVVAEGPTSSLLWIFQEWVAITFSFYNKTIYKIILIIMMSITFPLKFLDIFLRKHPFAKQISAGFYIIGNK